MMGFNKFIETMTIIDTVIFTISTTFILIMSGNLWIAINIIVFPPLCGLMLLSFYGVNCDEYKHEKDLLEKSQERYPYHDFRKDFRKIRWGYIESVIIVIAWNIFLFVIIILFLNKFFFI